jgi:SAM-dependent methyltransferase
MNKEISEKNREAWNEAMVYHQKARKGSLQEGFKNPNFTTLNRDCDEILIGKLNEIDFKEKIIAQLPCNNGRELLSLVKLGAKKGIGFDISDAAIAEANELKAISNLNAEFYRTNILDIDDTFNNSIDFIYISEGSLQWFSSLNDYFNIVSKLLKPNGKILIYEIHPFAYFLKLPMIQAKNQHWTSSFHILKSNLIRIKTDWIMLAKQPIQPKNAVGICTRFPI